MEASGMMQEPIPEYTPIEEGELGGFAPEPEPPKAEPWPEPQPLPGLLPIAPEMPKRIIPAQFQNFISDIADRMQIATEVPATALIAALSSVVGRTLGIFPKRADSWLVVPNTWGFVAARSGMLKSPAIEAAVMPLGILARTARIQHEQQRREYAADAEISDARIESVKKEIGAIIKGGRESELPGAKQKLIELQLQAENQKPIERRYKINDGTIEKILELIVENPRGLFVYRDELSGWWRSLDKAGREMDRAFYLESWNGTGSFTMDRIGRGTTHVDGLCLSVFGGIQPGKLQDYISDALEGTANDDGLVQRFQLGVWPEPPKVWNLIDRAPDRAAKDRVARIFEIIDTLNPEALGLRADYGIPALHFDDEAQRLFNDWLTNLQRRLLQGEGSPALESHLAKYRSLMPSLALLFHLAEWADNQIGTMFTPLSAVSIEAARQAAAWCDYMELHARKIYAGTLNPELQKAHIILQKIDQGKIKDGTSVRDVYRSGWTGLNDRDLVTQGLLLLAEHNYLRLVSLKGDTGRASDTILLNPKRGNNAATISGLLIPAQNFEPSRIEL
jgi:hypothetical protein